MRYEKAVFAAAGALAATLGVRIIKSRDARKLYVKSTAAVLREKDRIMAGVTGIRAECGDILAEAKDMNAALSESQEQIIEDTSAAEAPEAG